jgi:hypothetical protein
MEQVGRDIIMGTEKTGMRLWGRVGVGHVHMCVRHRLAGMSMEDEGLMQPMSIGFETLVVLMR